MFKQGSREVMIFALMGTVLMSALGILGNVLPLAGILLYPAAIKLHAISTNSMLAEMLFHAHRSWTDQWFTEHLYVPGGDNDYIAYISLKAVGPAYVKDSKEKTSAIWSDRVLLVREK